MASRFVNKGNNESDDDDDDQPSSSLRASISRERSALVQKLMSNPESANGARPSAYSSTSSRTEKLLRSAKALKAEQEKGGQHHRKKSWTSFSSSLPTGDNAPPLPTHQRKKSLTETLAALTGGGSKKESASSNGASGSNGLHPKMASTSQLASPQGHAFRKTASKTPDGLPKPIPEETSMGSPPLSQRKAPSTGSASDGMVPTSSTGPLPSSKGLGSPTKSNRKATSASTASGGESGANMSRNASAATTTSIASKKPDSKLPQPEAFGKTSTPASTSSSARIESRTQSLIRRLSAGRPSFLSSSTSSSSTSTKMAVSAGSGSAQSKTSSTSTTATATTAKEDQVSALPRVTPQRRLLMRMHSSNAGATTAADESSNRPGALLDREIKRKQEQDETKELSTLMERFGGALATT